jgi:hypothetical protein
MKLAKSLNRTVLVSIPAFFGDDDARACTLIDVEAAGLWLACDDLRDRLGPAHEISAKWTAPVTGLFPFSQILYAVDPSQFAALARGPQPPTRPGPGPPGVTKDRAREHAHREGRLKQKDSKGRR